GFRDFAEARNETPRKSNPPTDTKPKEPVAARSAREGSKDDGKATRKAQFEQERAGARAAERKRRRIEQLEKLIAQAEETATALREELNQDPAGNWEKVARLAREEQAVSKRLEVLMAEWTTLSEEAAREDAPASGGNRA